MRYVRMRRKLQKRKELPKRKYTTVEMNQTITKNNKNPDIIDRRTYHGDGVPKTDLYIYNNEIRYCNQQTTWGCQNCDYKVRKRRRTKISGHVASARGHTSRKQTTRWDIPSMGNTGNKTKIYGTWRRKWPNATFRKERRGNYIRNN